MDDPPTPSVRAADVARLVASIFGAGAAVVGGLMLLVGPGSLLPTDSTGLAVAATLFVVGLAVAAGAALSSPSGFRRAAVALTPRVYPFAPVPLNAVLYVVLLIGAVSVFHGFFDVFTSAHNGGNTGSLSDQDDLQALLISGSVVVWVLTMYTIFVMFRVIRMGRAVDAQGGTDAYGQRVDPGPIPRIPFARRGVAPAPPARESRAVLFGVSIGLALAISAGIQVLEVNVSPAPAIDWVYAQTLTPIWAAVVAAAIGGLDRIIRGLERSFLEVVRVAAPAPDPGASSD